MIFRTAPITLLLALALCLAPGARAASGEAAVPVTSGNPAAAEAVAAPGPPVAPVAPAPAAPVGKRPAVLEGDQVLVSAEHLERGHQERIVIGEGAVTIRHRDMRLVADRVVYMN